MKNINVKFSFGNILILLLLNISINKAYSQTSNQDIRISNDIEEPFVYKYTIQILSNQNNISENEILKLIPIENFIQNNEFINHELVFTINSSNHQKIFQLIEDQLNKKGVFIEKTAIESIEIISNNIK